MFTNFLTTMRTSKSHASVTPVSSLVSSYYRSYYSY